MLAWDAVRRGAAGTGGNVAAVLTGSLVQMREVIDRSLAEVRLDSATIALERVVLADFIEGEEIAASIHARAHGIELSVAPIDLGLTVLIDPQVLASALANLLHNAFKLTRLHTRVKLTARGTDTRVYIEVEDECGGLPPGAAQNLLCLAELPRARGPRAGVGLRRAIRAVEANGGHLHVKDLPGQGCRFTIDLPRLAPGNTAPTKTNGVPS
jgi:signal transduction histidine kinase